MRSPIFNQSEMEDPYAFYADMLLRHPITYDEVNQSWVVYPYDACLSVLMSPHADIPQQSQTEFDLMNEVTQQVVGHLVRLQNSPEHDAIRSTVVQLFESMRSVDIGRLLEKLIRLSPTRELDWVTEVGKTLPVLSLLSGFQFSQADTELVLDKILQLTTVMSPTKSEALILDLNAAMSAVYPVIEQHLTQSKSFYKSIKDQAKNVSQQDDQLTVLTSNLIGLLIQSFDAGRGLLGNVLLRLLNNQGQVAPHNRRQKDFRKTVIETLRFDPPIHNTRRTLSRDSVIGGMEIKPGERVLIVLAAANRDPNHFHNPNRYDEDRFNNETHLTFGSGAHACLAKRFMVNLTADVFTHLFDRCPNIELIQDQIEYEPLVNARLPVELRLRHDIK